MSSTKQIGDVDAAITALSPYGRYTLVQYVLVVLANVVIGQQMLSIVFTGQKNPFRCPMIQELNVTNLTLAELHNTSVNNFNSVCHIYDVDEEFGHFLNGSLSCTPSEVEYKLPKDLYFTTEFDLVCDREYLAGLTQTFLILGHGISAIIFPLFADRLGRKPILILSSFLLLGSSLGQAFSTNYAMLVIFKTLAGIFNQGLLQTGVAVMCESLTRSQRGFMAGCVSSICWSAALFVITPMAYGLRNHTWRTLELAMSSFFAYIVLHILYVFSFLDEPIRWLAANGLRKPVLRILKRASKWNGRNSAEVISAFNQENKNPMIHGKTDQTSEGSPNNNTSGHSDNPQVLNFQSNISVEGEKVNLPPSKEETGLLPQSNHAEEEKLNFFSLFKYPILRINTIFCAFAWCLNSLTYFALILMSSTLSGSLYLNFFLNCLVEIHQALVCYFYIDSLGRKKMFATFSILAGLSLLGAAFTRSVYPDEGLAIKILTIFGKFAITGSFNVLYTQTPELFPTNIRTMGIGVASMSARVGGMVAPFAETLMDKAIYAPGVVFGVGSLILSAMTYFLPETAGRQLPQSLKDMQEWKNDPVKRTSVSSSQISLEITPRNKNDQSESSSNIKK